MARVFTITEGLENMGAMKTGGQGSVYKGRRTGDIFTAIKILPTPIHSESADDKNFTAFQNEVQKLKRVNQETNPNVVKIISSGITDTGNLPFIEMEFIEGPDLEELIKPPHDAVFSVKEIIKVAEQLSCALAHCHKQDVRHGDIKSNNVKFNKHTGNYVLLDFGLAIMSDEQRRSSMRHAGAIEFMAPEQNEGQMLFQTDVYGFGVVLFELLAGSVPFPLSDKGETARNLVMVAHMETLPPDLLSLRRAALPESWDGQKQQSEMQVPQWLVNVVYKCLQKKPAARFANGIELHDFIVANSISSESIAGAEHLAFLQQEIARLRHEKEELQQQLSKFQTGARPSASPQFATGERPAQPPPVDTSYTAPKKDSATLNILLAIFITVVVIAAVYYFIKKSDPVKPASTAATRTGLPAERRVVGEYIVTADKAYFYNQADEDTRRNAYAIASNEIIKAMEDRNGFVYTELTNSKGQVSKGWLKKEDMITLAEWSSRNANVRPADDVLSEEEISLRLNDARVLLNAKKVADAIKIYKELSGKNVSEATYQYANLALQNRHNEISCNEAFNLLTKLGNEGYVPAKRTLGFLYSFADDDPELLDNNYDRCNFVKNVAKGSKLLMEAILTGDSTARRFLDELNQKSQQNGTTSPAQ